MMLNLYKNFSWIHRYWKYRKVKIQKVFHPIVEKSKSQKERPLSLPETFFFAPALKINWANFLIKWEDCNNFRLRGVIRILENFPLIYNILFLLFEAIVIKWNNFMTYVQWICVQQWYFASKIVMTNCEKKLF